MSTYEIEGRDDYIARKNTIIENLQLLDVFEVDKTEDGRFRVEEGCDNYYFAYLTKEQLIDFGNELIKMANDE